MKLVSASALAVALGLTGTAQAATYTVSVDSELTSLGFFLFQDDDDFYTEFAPDDPRLVNSALADVQQQLTSRVSITMDDAPGSALQFDRCTGLFFGFCGANGPVEGTPIRNSRTESSSFQFDPLSGAFDFHRTNGLTYSLRISDQAFSYVDDYLYDWSNGSGVFSADDGLRVAYSHSAVRVALADDNPQITAMPVPASLPLLFAAFAAFGILKRRVG